jgi:hypothetical protein
MLEGSRKEMPEKMPSPHMINLGAEGHIKETLGGIMENALNKEPFRREVLFGIMEENFCWEGIIGLAKMGN